MTDTIIPSLRPDGWTDEDLAYRPEVMANAPSWCNHVDVFFENDGSIGIGYAFRHGSVEISTAAIGENGIVTPADDGGGVSLLHGHGGGDSGDLAWLCRGLPRRR